MLKNKNEQGFKNILKKYLLGEANGEETERVDSWYRQLDREPVEEHIFASAAIKEELLNDIQQYLYQYTAPEKKNRSFSTILQHSYFRVAAVLLLCLGVAWLFRYQQKSVLQQELLISTLPGTHKEVRLTDGTIVLLNAKSKLRVAKDFGMNDRKVFLEGEAFFKVLGNPGKPFFIGSGPISTRVLGTSFNVNAYPEKERIKVVVSSGKVQVLKTVAGKTSVLAGAVTSDQSVSYSRTSGKYEFKQEDAALTASWKDNRLYIDNATIAEIGHQLELHYNIKVLNLLKDQLKDRYTIRFNHESIQSVLKILSMLTKHQFTYSNQQILIQ